MLTQLIAAIQILKQSVSEIISNRLMNLSLIEQTLFFLRSTMLNLDSTEQETQMLSELEYLHFNLLKYKNQIAALEVVWTAEELNRLDSVTRKPGTRNQFFAKMQKEQFDKKELSALHR